MARANRQRNRNHRLHSQLNHNQASDKSLSTLKSSKFNLIIPYSKLIKRALKMLTRFDSPLASLLNVKISTLKLSQLFLFKLKFVRSLPQQWACQLEFSRFSRVSLSVNVSFFSFEFKIYKNLKHAMFGAQCWLLLMLR